LDAPLRLALYIDGPGHLVLLQKRFCDELVHPIDEIYRFTCGLVFDAVPDDIGLEMEYKPPKAHGAQIVIRWLSRDRKSPSKQLIVGDAIAIVMGVHLGTENHHRNS
jgi:hypothetical protein